MRPVREKQGALRAPLNGILGTEAGVRLLRVLETASEPIGVGALARGAGVQRATAHRRLERLVRSEVVRAIGTGRGRQYELAEHPLAPALRALFQSERSRLESVLGSIRERIDALRPPPRSAWIEGKVAEGRDDYDDPIVVVVVGSSGSIDEQAEGLRSDLSWVERDHYVTVEVKGRTEADLVGLGRVGDSGGRARLHLMGLPPDVFAAPDDAGGAGRAAGAAPHAVHDRRADELGRAVAEQIERDPTIVGRTVAWIERRLEKASPGERRELVEWRRILESRPPLRVAAFLRSRSERAARLRQTLPFVEVLTAEERTAIMRRDHDAE